MFEDARLLLVAGAPRSGTTLLTDMLDANHQILRFPEEHSTLERFFLNRNRIETYARTEFISNLSEGMQALLANRDLYLQKQESRRKEINKDFGIPIDFEKFKQGYLDFLDDNATTLSAMLLALAHGQTNACEVSRSKAERGVRWLLFKQPFFTEIFAKQAAEEIPHCKFIHIVRDPISRYASAKTRRLAQTKLNGKSLGPINRQSYVEGHTSIDILSYQLSMENVRRLGEDRYRVVRFEELLNSPKSTVEAILDWLDLETHDGIGKPSRLGMPAESGSVLSSGVDLDRQADSRRKQYETITSGSERQIHAALLNHYLKGEKLQVSSLIPLFLKPLPQSNPRNYLCQFNDMLRACTHQDPLPLDSFLERSRQCQVSVSGAT